MDSKLIVGSEEWCGLPELGIPAIKARVDSGAKTSSLHAFNIRSFTRDNQQWVSFELNPLQHNRRAVVKCEARVIDKRMVKSTSGISEKRFVIATRLHLGDQQWEIELTLNNRDAMGYRMLLGRQAMEERILVDPSSSFLCGTIARDDAQRQYGFDTEESERLNIGLLASNPELYSNQRLLEAVRARGHRIQFFDLKQCYIKLDAETPEIHYRGGQVLNDLDAVIPRMRTRLTGYGCALLREFESLGVYTLNSAQAIAKSRDRLYTLQVLMKSGVDIPASGFANSPADISSLIALTGGTPLVVRLLHHERSRGVLLAENEQAAESLVSSAGSTGNNLMLQEYIQEAEGQSVRVLVAGGRVLASIKQEAQAGGLLLKSKGRGHARPVKLSSKERRLAIKVVKTLGLEVAAVDIIRAARGPLLLDVSASPALESLETATGKDVAGALIELIEKKLAWKGAPAS